MTEHDRPQTACVFTLEGQPRTKGSFKTFKSGGVAPQQPDAIEWEERLRRAARRNWIGEPLPMGTPVRVVATFVFKRPKNHYGTGRNADKLKETAPEVPASGRKWDIDKLVRLVLDALTGVCYVDDCQVSTLDAGKYWAGSQGPHVTLSVHSLGRIEGV